MNGCFKGLLQLGCLALVLAGGAVAWWYRDPILHTAARWLGPKSRALPPVADTAVGAPTPGALGGAQQKLRDLGRPGGPDSIVLNPNEMASLIGSGIDWTVRKAFDSLRVELLEGSVAVHARLDTRKVPRDALGPLAGIVEPREPLRIAGPLSIERPGTARWAVAELSIRGIPFPPPTVKTIARKIAGADASGAVPVQVDRAIGGIAIHPTGVVLYRKAPS